MNKAKNRIEGYSLVETLVALAIGVVLVAFVFNIIILYSKSLTAQNRFVRVFQDLKFSMDFLKKEIREAGYEISMGEQITSAGASSLTFRKKVFNDIKKIQYYSNNSTLMEEVGIDSSFSTTNPRTIMANMESLQFEYFKENTMTPFRPLGASGREEIRKIRITITSRAPKENLNGDKNSYRRISLSSLVELKNMGKSYTLMLKATPDVVPDAVNSSAIEAIVFNRKGKPIDDGTTVSFSTNAGGLSPQSSRTLNGIASSTLTYGKTGFKIITVTARATIANSRLQGKIAIAFQ